MRSVAGWTILILVGVGLAGCTESDIPSGVTVIRETAPAEEREARQEYTFILYGSAWVEKADREVTIRVDIGDDGLPEDFIGYLAKPGAETEALRVYQTYRSVIYFDVVADDNVVRRATIDLAQCPHHDGDADVRVMDRRMNYADDNVEVEWGCSA